MLSLPETMKSSVCLTSNMSSLKLELFVFPDEQGKAQGWIYLDDMINQTQDGTLFFKIVYADQKTSVEIVSNSYAALKYDETKELKDQTFVKSL